MPRAVKYFFDGREWEVHFSQGSARLPAYNLKNNETRLMKWGRRPNEPGTLPWGGMARLNNIEGGRWNQWQPKNVRVAVRWFMEPDVADRPHWFPVTEGHWLHGLIATHGREQRIYLVTREIAPDETEYESWPKMVSAVS